MSSQIIDFLVEGSRDCVIDDDLKLLIEPISYIDVVGVYGNKRGGEQCF